MTEASRYIQCALYFNSHKGTHFSEMVTHIIPYYSPVTWGCHYSTTGRMAEFDHPWRWASLPWSWLWRKPDENSQKSNAIASHQPRHWKQIDIKHCKSNGLRECSFKGTKQRESFKIRETNRDDGLYRPEQSRRQTTGQLKQAKKPFHLHFLSHLAQTHTHTRHMCDV